MKRTLIFFLANIFVSAFFLSATAQSASSVKVYSKFDFIPGEKIIFFDDFSSENVGDFPVMWNTNGSGEVVTTTLASGKGEKEPVAPNNSSVNKALNRRVEFIKL